VQQKIVFFIKPDKKYKKLYNQMVKLLKLKTHPSPLIKIISILKHYFSINLKIWALKANKKAFGKNN